MSNQEIIYRTRMEKYARMENAKMRQIMGYNIAEDEEFNSPMLKVIEEFGEATVNDIARRMKMKKQQVYTHLRKLQKLDLVSSSNLENGKSLTIWSIKLKA